MDDRLKSAQHASMLHKRRTGKYLKVTRDIVKDEEWYEEVDEEVQQRYRPVLGADRRSICENCHKFIEQATCSKGASDAMITDLPLYSTVDYGNYSGLPQIALSSPHLHVENSSRLDITAISQQWPLTLRAPEVETNNLDSLAKGFPVASVRTLPETWLPAQIGPLPLVTSQSDTQTPGQQENHLDLILDEHLIGQSIYTLAVQPLFNIQSKLTLICAQVPDPDAQQSVLSDDTFTTFPSHQETRLGGGVLSLWDQHFDDTLLT